jgi:hypothetical protein
MALTDRLRRLAVAVGGVGFLVLAAVESVITTVLFAAA